MSNFVDTSSQQSPAEARDNFNSRLIQEVKKHSILYERRNHRDIEGVRSSWQAIGAALNAPAKFCETRWTSLRQTYSRKCQDPFNLDQKSGLVKWQWYREMEFVRPFILPRKRIRSSAALYENGEEEDGDYSDGAAFVANEEGGQLTYHQSDYTNGTCTDPLRLMESNMETACTTPETSLQDFHELRSDRHSVKNYDCLECGNRKRECLEDSSEWDVTGKMVAASLKRLRDKNARLLKIKILRLLCETEESEMLSENQV